jgi:hypothetical protein
MPAVKPQPVPPPPVWYRRWWDKLANWILKHAGI